MTKSIDNLKKVADTIELKLKKISQQQDDVYAFQKWVDTNFSTADKNKLATNIANSIEDDMNSLYVNLLISGGKLITDASVNGSPNGVAKKIIDSVIIPKISSIISKFPNGSKYVGWIKYPK